MWKKIRNFIFGFVAFITPLLSPFSFVFQFFNLDKLIVMYYIFAIILLLYAILRLKNDGFIRKNGVETKATQTTILAMTPEEKAQEVIETYKIWRKVGKLMLNFLKTYKGLIVSALIFVVTIVDTFTGMFGNVLVVNGVNILQVIGYGASTIIAALSYGLGSPQFKEAINNLKSSMKQEKESNDPSKALNYLKNSIKTIQNELNAMLNNYNKEVKKLETDYAEFIESYKMAQTLGVTVSSEVSQKIEQYKTKLQTLKNDYDLLTQEKNNLLATYKAKLEELSTKTA